MSHTLPPQQSQVGDSSLTGDEAIPGPVHSDTRPTDSVFISTAGPGLPTNPRTPGRSTNPTNPTNPGTAGVTGGQKRRTPRTGTSTRSARARTLAEISPRLRPRDLVIAELLDDHSVLTSGQLAEVLFGSPITCLHRLRVLRELGFVERFLRHRPGDPGAIHWVAGLLGRRYVALSRDGCPPTPGAVAERIDRLMTRPDLAHLVGVNGFFTSLLAAGRAGGRARLLRWWSERQAAAAFGQRIRPDGHGVWARGDAQAGFYLEYDTGRETIGALISKLGSYRRLLAEGGPNYPVLFWLPTQAREQNLHRRLASGLEAGVRVATASTDAVGTDGPAGPIWQLVGNDRHRLRLRLDELPSDHGRPGPLNPGAPSAEQDPLHLLR
jgi:hypothetical protein